MKLAIPCLLALFASVLPSQASASCQQAAEAAAYRAWYKPGQFVVGEVIGGTEIIWSRGGVTSYRVHIEYRKPDSQNYSYAAYYVRVQDSTCRVIQAKKR